MRLRSWLILMIGSASVVPIALLGVGAARISAEKVGEQVSGKQAQFVDGMALYVETWLELHLKLLKQLTRGFALESLGPEERTGFIRLVLHQVPAARMAVLVDASGQVAAIERRMASVDLPPVTAQQEAFFLERLPMQDLTEALARGEDVVVGRPYVPPDTELPVFPVLLRASPSLLLGAELGLQEIEEALEARVAPEQDLALLDDAGRIVFVGEEGLVSPDPFQMLVEVGAAETCADRVLYESNSGVDVIGACAFVPGPRWMVVIAEPTRTTLERIKWDIGKRTAYIAACGIAFASIIGFIWSRRIATPVTALKDAALTVAEGTLGLQVPPKTTDELTEISELAQAFNYMSTRLRQNRDTIDQKNREIEAFNVELQERVEARTRELEQAQARLVESARLAAVGEMGAGLAHELNNPLAGILGMVQVVLMKRRGQPEETMLKVIEEQTVRCSQIVAHLLRFSRPEPATPSVPSDWDEVELHEVVNEVLGLVRAAFQQKGVTVEHDESSGPLKVRGHRAQLGQALAQLLTSVRSASSEGQRIKISGARSPTQVELHVRLDGATTLRKDDWMASGMGFWVANRVFADHGGKLIEPQPSGAAPSSAQGAASEQRVWQVVLPEA